MWFGDRDLEEYWNGAPAPRRVPPDVRKRLVRRLQMLDAARTVEDLRVPPSNHLERLRGDLKGRWSLRVNGQWRLIFEWSEEGARDVRFGDYHR
ncbi:MAG: type II toxin-antitoxin system RelE/ParE family toxin [Micrococcales bacterium]|nr:type II toxin-antitoxin system RelE/ParE family toxin [Micrococcales bacterium]